VSAAAKTFSQWSSGRKIAAVAGAILLLGAIAFGSWNFLKGEATPEDSQRALWKYLRKQAGTRNFKPDLDLSTITLASPVARSTVTVTNKAGVARTVVRTAKPPTGKAAVNVMPETSLSIYFFTNQMQSETYKEMYFYIGQELYVAEQLLANSNIQQQIIGLAMATEASTYARTNAMNLWLGARICEAYLWPHLGLIENTNRMLLTPDALLNACDTAFQEAGETNNIIRNYELMITKVSRSPAYVDLLRYRLAHVYQDLGEEEKALPLLKQIKNYRMNRVPQEIAAMEQRLKKK
jgi:hypothetical protein